MTNEELQKKVNDLEEKLALIEKINKLEERLRNLEVNKYYYPNTTSYPCYPWQTPWITYTTGDTTSLCGS